MDSLSPEHRALIPQDGGIACRRRSPRRFRNQDAEAFKRMKQSKVTYHADARRGEGVAGHLRDDAQGVSACTVHAGKSSIAS